jgi:glycosyltransferase involved in cell wall biosynthesis
MPSLSVIVTTAPGREKNLEGCLLALTQQTYSNFEVIVVEDGEQNQEVCLHHQQQLPLLRYLGRPQDLCVARSRNLGVQAAQGHVLVLIDGDILLNPDALTAYQTALEQLPKAAFYGYFGTDQTLETPSYWFPERRVNAFDRRFRHFGSPTDIVYFDDKILRFPQKFAWSGNLGLLRSTYLAIGGFDEGYQGWGEEDVDFSERLIENNHQIHFLLDAWGEHQIHSRQEDFHRQAASGKQHNHLYTPITYTLETVASESGFQGFIQAMANHHSQYLN